MRTLKDVMGQAEERTNLRNVILCTVVVIVLVTLSFGMREFRSLFQKGPEEAQEVIEETFNP